MDFVKWLEGITKNLKWYDISLIKLSVFFSTLFLVVVWPAFRRFVMGFDWYWYLALAIIFAILPLKRVFIYKKPVKGKKK
jgi:hypothetical protein